MVQCFTVDGFSMKVMVKMIVIPSWKFEKMFQDYLSCFFTINIELKESENLQIIIVMIMGDK